MTKYLGKKIFHWDKGSIDNFWDFSSREPSKYFTYMVSEELIDFLKNDLNPEVKILDYGAGIGFLSEKLLKKGFQVMAIDSSTESLDKLNTKLSRYRNFLGVLDSNSIDVFDDKFDVIFVVEVIEHLNDQFLNELFEKVSRMLSENGKVIFTTPNKERLEDSYIYNPSNDMVFHRWQHVRSWDKNSLKEKLQEFGFSNLKIFETHLHSSPKWKGLNRKTLVNFLDYLKIKIEKKKPHLIAIAKKK